MYSRHPKNYYLRGLTNLQLFGTVGYGLYNLVEKLSLMQNGAAWKYFVTDFHLLGTIIQILCHRCESEHIFLNFRRTQSQALSK
jgi:hypothetical protein